MGACNERTAEVRNAYLYQDVLNHRKQVTRKLLALPHPRREGISNFLRPGLCGLVRQESDGPE